MSMLNNSDSKGPESLNTKLAIIGLDAQFAGLGDIDRVESALYKADLHRPDQQNTDNFLQQSDYSSLCKGSIARVAAANKLSVKKLAVIIISEGGEALAAAEQEYFRCISVNNLGAALIHSEKLISEFNLAVIIIAANLAADPSLQQDKATISFSADFNGYASHNGVLCLLLSSVDFAQSHGCYIYSYLLSAAFSSNAASSLNSNGQMPEVIKHSLRAAQLSAKRISSVEVSALGDPRLCDAEINALFKGYAHQQKLHTSISCCKSVLGENGSLSQLLGLLNSVFALQQRYRGSIKDWTRPPEDKLQAWHSSAFYLFNQAAPVFPNEGGTARYVAYSCLSADHYAHIILQENDDQLTHQNGFNACSDLSLFVLADNDQAGLLRRLQALSAGVNADNFKVSAKQFFKRFCQQQNSAFKIVLLAESCAELKQEISLALSGINNAFANNRDWKTPKGSYFTTTPMTTENKNSIAFLYPGIGATHVGLGRDLFHLFPQIYPSVLALADNIGASLKDHLMHPRSLIRLDFKQLQQLDLKLRRDLPNIAECGVGFACVFTKIFEQVFNIQADFSSGYSMGEVSMYAALGCWQKPGLMSARLANSDTFKQRLSGELYALREIWNLPDSTEGSGDPIWETYSIKGTVSSVSEAIQAGERVYITLVNTPDNLTIGGYPADCLQVIKRLGVRALPLNIANAIHSEPAYGEYQAMLDLYDMQVTERIKTKMYSSSCYLPIPQHNKAIAVSIAKCLCEPVDFPRLVTTLSEQGAAVFIEMGAGSSLCSWTDKILKKQAVTAGQSAANFLSVPVSVKGTDAQLTFARAAAKLLSFGVDINLNSFFYGSIIQPVQAVK